MVDHFITTCFTKLDPEGNGSFAGAHLDILIYRSEKKRVERIVTDGIWLGIVPDIREHTSEGTFKLGQGDLLFLYTDGVVEIANNKHEQYEMGRLVRFLERNGDKPPETVAGLLVKELEAFQDEQKDDFTFLVIKKELAGA
jgi:sigma-B regulation protein RsbU (phosphoserine phosphatase)